MHVSPAITTCLVFIFAKNSWVSTSLVAIFASNTLGMCPEVALIGVLVMPLTASLSIRGIMLCRNATTSCILRLLSFSVADTTTMTWPPPCVCDAVLCWASIWVTVSGASFMTSRASSAPFTLARSSMCWRYTFVSSTDPLTSDPPACRTNVLILLAVLSCISPLSTFSSSMASLRC